MTAPVAPPDFLLDEVVSVAIKAEFHSNGLSLEDEEGGSGVRSGHSTTTSPSRAAQSLRHNAVAQTLNEQEQDRIRELYQASRSLDEPMEKEVTTCLFLKQTSPFDLTIS